MDSNKEEINIINGLTIDAPNTRDLDDAFWLEKTGNTTTLHISITDVSQSIVAGSYLDVTAKKKCFTRYFRYENRPMLPHKFSEGSLSLFAETERPVITISIPIDSNFETGTATFRKAMLKSKAKLSYKRAAEIIENPNYNYHDMLNTCYKLAQVLFLKRRNEGAITIYSLKNKLATSEDGIVKVITPGEAHKSHIVIQEFMILANRKIANFFVKNTIPGLFRNHTAKDVAPERDRLIKDVNNVVNIGDLNRIDTLVEKFMLLFNRAEYSPFLEGHYALNIPAYMHFTSPIRRYADLINQRQLSAFIDAEKYPYSMDELKEIAAHINAVSLKYKEKTITYFKDKSRDRSLDFLANQNFDRVKPTEFYSIIKTAVAENLLPDSLKTILQKLLFSNNLESKEMFTILIKAKNASNWLDLKVEVLSWLTKNPQYTRSIFEIAKQKLQWSDIVYETEKSGLDHSMSFHSIAHISIDKKQYNSNLARNLKITSKKQSLHLANLSLLTNILGVDINITPNSVIKQPVENITTLASNQNSNPNQSKITTISGVNFIGKLIELCQDNSWESPQYTYEEKGEQHIPLFFCTANITINGTTYQTDKLVSINKKTGKQLASQELLKKIAHLPSNKPQEESQKNYIGQIYSLFQKHKLKMPKFSYEISNIHGFEQYKCTCLVYLKGTHEKKTFGFSVIKKTAKQLASQKMLDKIGELFD